MARLLLMKPTKRTMTRTYWACERDHKHMTKEVAQRCIDRNKGATVKSFGERRYKGIRLWLESRAFASIAKELGVHPGTVGGWRHMYLNAAARLEIGVSRLENNLVKPGRHYIIWDDEMTERLKLRDPKNFQGWKDLHQERADSYPDRQWGW